MANSIAKITREQDCSVIASAFERGVVHEETEESVFAPMRRVTEHNKSIGSGITTMLQSYGQQTDKRDPTTTTGLTVRNQSVTFPDPVRADFLGRLLKECIPCDTRLIISAGLRINQDLLAWLKADIKRRLDLLKNLRAILTDIDIYGDYCHLISFLNFMCVPDLQRIVRILLSYLASLSTDLLKIGNLLLAIILPLFSPILLNLTSLLDQLAQLVLSPLNCIISNINFQLRKVDVGIIFGDPSITNVQRKLDVIGQNANQNVQKLLSGPRSGLMELSGALIKGENVIRSKLTFYTNELNKMLFGDWSQSASLLGFSTDKLMVVRLIALARAMIKAKGKGYVCENTASPSNTEMNIFFDTFLSPSSPYAFTVDKEGDLSISNKPSKSAENIVTKAQPVISQEAISELSVRKIRCKVKATQEDAERVNDWMASLDKVNI